MAVTDKEIEEKLELYRLNKLKQKTSSPNFIYKVKNYFGSILTSIVSYILPDSEESLDSNLKHPDAGCIKGNVSLDKRKKIHIQKADVQRSRISKESDELTEPISVDERSSLLQTYSKMDFLALILKIVLWFILWKIFILIEFGAVFFVFSCFTFIWFNLYSGSRKRSGPSAYSVFNPNCEEITGAYTAEKFEKEFLHR